MAMGRAHVSDNELLAGRYRLLEIVHRETNRICWSGEDVRTSRPCLVTQIGLPDDDPHDGGERRAAARVLRTSETMERLCPGRIPTVLDAVDEAGALWTVTEWTEGTPLGDLLAERGPFTYVRAARLGLALLDVLDAAHGEGITHGELSPGQVLVRAEGSVAVTGYGLAGATLAPRLTAPSYASPEQARDERVGPAADLWALGAVLYTAVEGRPPFRDRGRPETTLRSVDRLPLRTPVRAGPLARVIQGLLRKDSRERLTRPVVREALTRVLTEEPGSAAGAVPRPRVRGGYAAASGAGRAWSGHATAAGTALAVVTVAVAVLAALHGLPGTGTSAADAPSRPPAVDAGPGDRPDGTTAPPPGSTAPTASPSAPPASSAVPEPPAPSASGTALPPGYRPYRAPEGFSVALPAGWRRQTTSPGADRAYRIVFGADGDPRTLAVTYSERLGPDPVAVWRDDVEPGLERTGGYRRIGAIRATTYQGREAADMEWYARAGGVRVRTFGRGFLLGGGRGFSLRWTAPAAGWDDAAGREALGTVLRTFRAGSA
ncbi:serine/threonine-protein kinase [Streptomyces sp. NPDC085946]|uniref:serine/threonine-protein kinase n=1 Tax=Streptomyces sp. NPDC085946 TaxID=3365744 RepID=UPI0037CE3C8A